MVLIDDYELEKYKTGLVPLSNEKILKRLLDELCPLDFKAELAKQHISIDAAREKHYLVVIVETLLQVATENKWDLAKQDDFIYLFNGAFWSLQSKDSIKSFLKEGAVKLGYPAINARHYEFIERLYKQFLSDANFRNPVETNSSVKINLQNGTLVIENNGYFLKGFDSRDFLTYQLPFLYEPASPCPMFERYLNEVLPDKELQAVLQEYIGYIFVKTSILKLEKCLVLHGDGQNGKSVFFDITNALLGITNISNYSSKDLNEEHYRALIKNKLVNYTSEFGSGIESELFKQLVSGEPVGARLKYGNPFTMFDYAKLIFNTNSLPQNVEHNKAYFRRFLIIPFEYSVPEEKVDPNLAKKIIQNELCGIFNWALKGLDRILSNKCFTSSKRMSEALQEYKKESDSVHLFIEEQGYSKSSDQKQQLKHLYGAYKDFCKDDNYKPVGKKNFSKRLERLGFEKEKDRDGIYFAMDKSGYVY